MPKCSASASHEKAPRRGFGLVGLLPHKRGSGHGQANAHPHSAVLRFAAFRCGIHPGIHRIHTFLGGVNGLLTDAVLTKRRVSIACGTLRLSRFVARCLSRWRARCANLAHLLGAFANRAANRSLARWCCKALDSASDMHSKAKPVDASKPSEANAGPQQATDSTHLQSPKPNAWRSPTMLSDAEIELLRQETRRDMARIKELIAARLGEPEG